MTTPLVGSFVFEQPVPGGVSYGLLAVTNAPMPYVVVKVLPDGTRERCRWARSVADGKAKIGLLAEAHGAFDSVPMRRRARGLAR